MARARSNSSATAVRVRRRLSDEGPDPLLPVPILAGRSAREIPMAANSAGTHSFPPFFPSVPNISSNNSSNRRMQRGHGVGAATGSRGCVHGVRTEGACGTGTGSKARDKGDGGAGREDYGGCDGGAWEEGGSGARRQVCDYGQGSPALPLPMADSALAHALRPLHAAAGSSRPRQGPTAASTFPAAPA